MDTFGSSTTPVIPVILAEVYQADRKKLKWLIADGAFGPSAFDANERCKVRLSLLTALLGEKA